MSDERLVASVVKAIEDADIAHPRLSGVPASDRRSVGYYLRVGLDAFNHNPIGGTLDRALLEAAAKAAIDAVAAHPRRDT